MKYIVIIVLFFLSCTTNQFISLEKFKYPEFTAYEKKYDQCYVLDNAEYELQPDGILNIKYHSIMRLNNKAALKSAYQIFRYSSTRKLIHFNGRLIHQDGDVEEFSPSDLADYSLDYDVLYSKVRAKIFSLVNKAKVGDLFEYFVEYEETQPQLGQKLFISEGFPKREFNIKLTIPKQYDLKYKIVGNDTLKPEINITEKKKVYTFQKKNIKKATIYSLGPNIGNQYSSIAFQFPIYPLNNGFQELNNWADFSYWIESLNAGTLDLTNEMKNEINTLISDTDTKYTKIKKIYEYVRSKVRYVQIYMENGGYKPHTAKDIFKNKYGDCKDYTTLIRALLKEAGIKSHYALVFSGDRQLLFDDIITSQFNHAIVYVPTKDGDMWLDGTSKTLEIGVPSYSVTNKFALIIDGKNSYTKQIKPHSGNKIHINISHDLKTNITKLKFRLDHQYSQRLKMAHFYLNNDRFNKFKREFLANKFPFSFEKAITYTEKETFVELETSIIGAPILIDIANTHYLNLKEIFGKFFTRITTKQTNSSLPMFHGNYLTGDINISITGIFSKKHEIKQQESSTHFTSKITNSNGIISYTSKFNLENSIIPVNEQNSFVDHYSKLLNEYNSIIKL